MSNWLKDAANTDISPAIAKASGWGPRKYLTGVHSAWLLVHAVALHGLGAWLTYSAAGSAQRASMQMASEFPGIRQSGATEPIGQALRMNSFGLFISTCAWCLAAYACSRVIAEAVYGRRAASE